MSLKEAHISKSCMNSETVVETSVDVNKCMICCKTTDIEYIGKVRDDDTRSVYKCLSCGHVQLLPLPTQDEDDEFYQSDTMYKSVFDGDARFRSEEQLMHRYRAFVDEQAGHLEKHIVKINRPKILDIGTGYGWLVEVMRERGYLIDGVELSDEKRELCKNRCGIEIFDWNFLSDVPDAKAWFGYYDVICLMQTLEHISNPILFLRRAGELLRPGGMIFIDVPNFDDYMKAELPEYNDFAYSRMHLSYFTPDTLKYCMIRKCLKINYTTKPTSNLPLLIGKRLICKVYYRALPKFGFCRY